MLKWNTLTENSEPAKKKRFGIYNMKKDKAEALGFVPQKDIVYNKLLPYADKLDIESNEILCKIKGNLARAVQLRELWPGVLFWTRKLST